MRDTRGLDCSLDRMEDRVGEGVVVSLASSMSEATVEACLDLVTLPSRANLRAAVILEMEDSVVVVVVLVVLEGVVVSEVA